MDIKKITVVMLGIAMVCLIVGAIYLEKDTGDKVKVRYVIDNDDFSYDGEELIVDNKIIEDAEDIEVYDDGVEYSIYEGGEINSITPILLICIIMIGLFMILVVWE